MLFVQLPKLEIPSCTLILGCNCSPHSTVCPTKVPRNITVQYTLTFFGPGVASQREYQPPQDTDGPTKNPTASQRHQQPPREADCLSEKFYYCELFQ